MKFDTAKLTMKQQLSLCEMVTFLAWGEAMTADRLEISLSPTERVYQGEWDAQLEECRREAGAKSKLSYLVQLLDDWRDTPTMPTADALDKVCKSEALARMIERGELNNDHKEPTPEQHKTIRVTWPMACRHLYDLALARRNRRLSEKENLWKAGRRWQEAAQDGNLIVTGKRRGVRDAKREVIDHADFAVYELDWKTDSLELPIHHRLGSPGAKRPYDDVSCERISFVRWLQSVSDTPPERGRGAPVEYPDDKLIVEEALAILERDPRRPRRQLILDLARKHDCHPTKLADMDRLSDRVGKKIRNRRRSAAQKTE